jgi:outer membrane protein assembly factor BamE (lipoprotein component of BamABCDE complex)
MKTVLVFIAAVLLAGCATVGREISDAQIDTLKKGETTAAQVIASFGQPTSTTKMSDGRYMVSYIFAHAQARPASFIPVVGLFAGGSDVRSSMVMLTFNKEGVLQDYTSSSSSTGMGAGLAAGAYTQPDMTLPQEAQKP